MHWRFFALAFSFREIETKNMDQGARYCIVFDLHTMSFKGRFTRLNILLLLCWAPKIPEISVGIQMARFVSVSSDRNIREHLWRSTSVGIYF